MNSGASSYEINADLVCTKRFPASNKLLGFTQTLTKVHGTRTLATTFGALLVKSCLLQLTLELTII